MLKYILLKLRHRLTAYHLRNMIAEKRGKKKTILFVCSCGWHPPRYRDHTKFIRPLRCLVRCGHEWDEWDAVEIGGAWQDDNGVWHSEIDEGMGTVIAWQRQCKRCWCIQSKPPEFKTK